MSNMSYIGGVFQVILDKKIIPEKIQNKIYQHALINNDYELIVKLINLENLNSNLDKEIAKIKNSKVRSAWLSKKGRSVSEISEILQNEKRKKVINELINNQYSYSNLINAIVESSSNIDTLHTVSNGKQFSKSSRALSSEKLLILKIKEVREYTKSIESYQAEELIALFEENRKLLSKYANETSPTFLFAKSAFLKLNCKEDAIVFDILYNKSLGKINDKNLSYYNTKSLKNLFEFIYNSLKFSEISVANHEKLQALFNKVLSKPSLSFYFDEIKVINEIILLRKEHNLPLVEFVNSLQSADEFNNIVNSILSLITKHNATDNYFFEKMISSFLDSKLLSPSNYGKLLIWYPSDFGAIKRAAKKLDELEIEKQAYLLLHSVVNYEYKSVDQLLKLFTNPLSVYSNAIKIVTLSNEYSNAVHALVSSKYLNKDLLSYFSFSQLSLISDNNRKYSETLQSIIEDIVDDENGWLNFVNLANEFEGSLSEFITLSKKL